MSGWKIRLRIAAHAVVLTAHVAILSPSIAADTSATKLQWFAIVGATSDYVYRGVSLNDERPTAIGYFDVSYGMLYFNGQLIGTELGADALGRDIGKLEADATFGIRHSFGAAEVNVGAKYTGYPTGRDLIVGTLQSAERDFIEPFVSVTTSLSKELTLTSTLYWTPDYYYESGEVTTAEAQIAYQLPAIGELQPKFTAFGGLAHSANANIVCPGHEYLYWNAGIEARLNSFVFDIRYWDTDVKGLDGFESRVVFSAGVLLN